MQYYLIVQPPSTTIFWPVIYEDAELIRKITDPNNSSGLPILPNGTFLQRIFVNKIVIAAFFSILVAGSTSSIAWLLDPAIEKIFIEKDQTLILIIPILIIVAFATKGGSLYMAKTTMISVGEEIKKKLQLDMVKTLIQTDTQTIDKKHSGKFISNLTYDTLTLSILDTGGQYFLFLK